MDQAPEESERVNNNTSVRSRWKRDERRKRRNLQWLIFLQVSLSFYRISDRSSFTSATTLSPFRFSRERRKMNEECFPSSSSMNNWEDALCPLINIQNRINSCLMSSSEVMDHYSFHLSIEDEESKNERACSTGKEKKGKKQSLSGIDDVLLLLFISLSARVTKNEQRRSFLSRRKLPENDSNHIDQVR